MDSERMMHQNFQSRGGRSFCSGVGMLGNTVIEAFPLVLSTLVEVERKGMVSGFMMARRGLWSNMAVNGQLLIRLEDSQSVIRVRAEDSNVDIFMG